MFHGLMLSNELVVVLLTVVTVVFKGVTLVFSCIMDTKFDCVV